MAMVKQGISNQPLCLARARAARRVSGTWVNLLLSTRAPSLSLFPKKLSFTQIRDKKLSRTARGAKVDKQNLRVLMC
jgi:hypothetical protein